MTKEERLKAAALKFYPIKNKNRIYEYSQNDIQEYRKKAFLNGANHQNEINKLTLIEALNALNWMWENMEVTNKNLQSDAFNIPANAIAELERSLGLIND